MAFLNKEHLFFSSVFVKELINVLKRDEGILFRSNENAGRCDKVDQRIEIYFINIEMGLLHDDRLDVLVCHTQEDFREIRSLLADLDE